MIGLRQTAETPSQQVTIVILLVVIPTVAGGCASGPPEFSGEVIWQVNDRHPIEAPAPREASVYWQAIDATLFRPVSRGLRLERPPPAKNVNALGHVPDSSWYTNRMSVATLPPDRVARGACEEGRMPRGKPWIIVGGSIAETNPGLVVDVVAEDGSETRYLLRVEGPDQTQRATAAGALGADIYWAAGFQTPCNRVVYVDPERLVLAEEATKENEFGDESPMTEEDVEAILAHTTRSPEGRLRVMASESLPGEPLGPFSWEGTRNDDPNDVIPHQHRRELRGSRLLAAWINHFDVREQNTHTSFISPEETPLGYVQHFMQGFGEAFGSTGPSEGVTRRFGYSYYVDLGHILTDLLTLGLIRRPWHELEIAEEAPIFGFFGAAHFEPEAWKPGFPNIAFRMMDDRDAFWATNIISRFSEAHIRRLVEQANFSEEVYSRYLVRTLIGRRDAIVETYFTEMSPLVEPSAGRDRLCVTDAWVARGYGEAADARYEVRRTATGSERRGSWGRVGAKDEGGRICVSVPSAEEWSRRAGELVVEMRVRRVGGEAWARSVRFFLRSASDGAYKIVGVLRVGEHP